MLLLLLLLAAVIGSSSSLPDATGPNIRQTFKGEKAGANGMYIVMLKSSPVAAYSGGVLGMAATSASSTGRPLLANSENIQRYSAYLKKRSNTVASQALGTTSSIVVYYTHVLAGFAAGPLDNRQLAALRKHKDVQAVFPNSKVSSNTVKTPSFLELDTPGGVWSQLGGASGAGEDMIVGVIDNGEPHHTYDLYGCTGWLLHVCTLGITAYKRLSQAAVEYV
jgi:hypothetical protein